MEHKPLIERLWGIARTHSFAAFESCLHEACPDGSLKALSEALRVLTGAGQHALAQDLLGESLENHVASPQILWRLDMILLLGQPGAGKGTAAAEDLATLERTVKALVQADQLDDAIARVGEAAKASAAPELYELLGRLHLRRSATAPAPTVDAKPAAVTASAQPAPAAIEPADATRATEQAVISRLPTAAAPVEPRLQEPKAEQPAPPPRAAAVEPPAAKVETPRPSTPPASAAPAFSRPAEPRPSTATPPAESADKAKAAEPPQWVAEELLKARARAQETMQKRAEAKADAASVAQPVITAIAAAAPRAEPAPAPVEIPKPDEPKEQVFARLREAFAKLGKTERKLLAWIMANPNQNAAQIAKHTELGSAEVTAALKGLTGLWLDPFTFAGYTVRDYVLECMSMGKPAPAGSRPSAPASAGPASRTTAPSPARVADAPRPAAPAPRTEPAPTAAKPARAAAPSPALAGLSKLDKQVLEYIHNHPGCSPDDVMDAMGPDEPASVSLVTLRREWLERDAQGRYTIKPAMLDLVPNGDRAESPAPAASPEPEPEDEEVAETAPPRKSRIMETLAASPLAVSATTADPLQKERARLAKLPKGQQQILQFLHDNGQARTKDIARALDQDAAKVNSALLGPLAGFVSVMHSFWRLNDEIRPALAPVELDEAAEG